MIVSRAPVRITLGGGGTDLASYYREHGGFLIAGAIDLYVYVCLNRRFFESIRLNYSTSETVDSVDDIQHPVFRECLKKHGIRGRIECASISDVTANCGLGTSSTFTVSLLNAIRAYKRDYASLAELAEEACEIEIDRLGEPIGKQDQYMAAFGGVTCLEFERDGTVHVSPLNISPERLQRLEQNILLFYTGIERNSREILRDQDENSKKKQAPTIDTLHRIKEIGLETRSLLESGNMDSFGELLHEHWLTKKRLSTKVSNPQIDEWYDIARRHGALGGKVMGAGGGGFFMFYVTENHAELTETFKKMGLARTFFRFDFEGAKVVANMKSTSYIARQL